MKQTIVQKMLPHAIKNGVRAVGLVSKEKAAEIALKVFTTPQRIPRPPWEVRLAEKGIRLQVSGGLSAIYWGSHGRPRVLLVHGWQGRGTQLGAVVEPLLEAGFQVIALDGPGHGDSPGDRLNVRLFAEILNEVDKEIGPFKAVVAHSFGAGATSYALAHGLRTERVVLVAAPAELKWVVEDFCAKMEFSQPLAQAFVRRLEKWVGVPAEAVAVSGLGRNMRVPALIVHDPSDLEVPYSHAERIVESWPESRLFRIEGVGHRRILKSPAFVSGVVDFVSEENRLKIVD